MILGVQATDITAGVLVAGSVTPPIGGFLLVIKWIVNFQKEITDKYRQELFEVRKEFDAYKLETEAKLFAMNSRLDSLMSVVEDTEVYNKQLVTFIHDQGLALPPELDRRKA